MNPKTSQELKKLRGTDRADRQRPIAAGERLKEPPEAPDTLSPGAVQEWKALAPVLVELGTVCRGDLRAFEQLCETLATANALQAAIETEGVLIKTGTGSFKTNPAQRSLETARNQATRLFTEFGLTPKARNYVSRVPDSGGYNPYEHLEDNFVDLNDDFPTLKRGFQSQPRGGSFGRT